MLGLGLYWLPVLQIKLQVMDKTLSSESKKQGLLIWIYFVILA